MFCPHCHNKIPDGSNICPLCYANLAGVKPSPAPKTAANQDEPEHTPVRKSSKSSKKAAYTKGSRGGKRRADMTPMIVAFGLVVILVIIIVMIFKSMFGAGDGKNPAAAVTTPPVTQSTPGNNFVVFGATPTPGPQIVITPTPAIEITPTPVPAQPKYTTLRKNNEGPEVMTLQKALVELGYLTGATDGKFGTATETAVKKFQEAKGLDADGIAGKKTLEALYSESSVTPIPETTVGPNDIMNLPG